MDGDVGATGGARRRATARRLVTGLLAAGVLAATSFAADHRTVAEAALDGGAYVAVGPARILDTRDGGAPMAAGEERVVDVSRMVGVPADATAAAVSIVLTDTTAAGFVTLWPGGVRPATSSVNADGPGQSRASLALVPIGSDGTIRVFTSVAAHVVIDLTGVFSPGVTDSSGRFTALSPVRAIDTRGDARPFAPGEERVIDLTASGLARTATAAVVSITVIGAPGWWSAWPADRPWPGTSSVNATSIAPTAATAIVPLTDGRMSVMSQSGGDLVIDVMGAFGPAATGTGDSSAGRFVTVTPVRVLDTRQSTLDARLRAGSAVTPVTYPFSMSSAAAVAATVTAIAPARDAFLTAYPANTERPLASVANAQRGQIVGNGTVVRASQYGLAVFTNADTHLAIDITGYFIGTAATAPTTPTPAPSAPLPGPGFSFLFRHNGTYARWDPCKPITWYVNYDNAPVSARQDVPTAIARVMAATGLDLRSGGETTAANASQLPNRPTSNANAAIVVAFQPLGSGIGGTGGGTLTMIGGLPVMFAGTATVNSDMTWRPGFGGHGSLGTVLLHELGHVIGLGHIESSDQVMYPVLTQFAEFQPGDLAGLGQLGKEKGCVLPATQATRTEGASNPYLNTPVHEFEIADDFEAHDH